MAWVSNEMSIQPKIKEASWIRVGKEGSLFFVRRVCQLNYGKKKTKLFTSRAACL